MIFVVILFILIVFSVGLTLVWMWFFKNEKAFCEKLYNKGLKEFKSEQYKKARTLFSRITIMIPDFKDTRYRLGLTYLKLKEYEKAKTEFELCLKTSPDDFDILFNLALSLLNLKLYEQAEEFYLKALDKNEKDVNCFFGLGLINYNLKKFETAMQFFQKADELSPNNPLYLFYINRCKDELCTYDEEEQVNTIIEAYLKLLEYPNLPKEFHIVLAGAYAKSGNIQESEKYCKLALTKNFENVECYKVLGLIQLIKKDLEETKNTLKTALNLQPNNEEIHNLLSYTLCYQVDDCPLGTCRQKYYELIKKFLK